MNYSYISILLAGLLPYIWIVLAKGSVKNFDNKLPRDALQVLIGWQKRANYAHCNAFEAFPFFAVSVVICNLKGVNVILLNSLAYLYLICRIGHGLSYICDLSKARSSAWAIGFILNVTLYLIAI